MRGRPTPPPLSKEVMGTKCPNHYIPLVPFGKMSLVCPRCDFKIYRRERFWKPEVRHIVAVPSGFLWSSFTLTGCETVGDTIVMSSGETTASAVSGQISNLTKDEQNKKDISRVKIVSTETENDGSVSYFASNDAGVNYLKLKTQNAIFRLDDGREIPLKLTYNDLRIKVTLSRDDAGDSSPVVSTMLVTHNYKGDGI